MKSLESRAYILIICRPVFTSRFFGLSQFGGFLRKMSNWKDNKRNTGSPARFWQTRRHENNFTLSFLLLWGIVRRESPLSAGRQCFHTLTAGTRWTWLHKHRWGIWRLTIRACDWVSGSAKLLPQSRHNPRIVKKLMIHSKENSDCVPCRRATWCRRCCFCLTFCPAVDPTQGMCTSAMLKRHHTGAVLYLQ